MGTSICLSLRMEFFFGGVVEHPLVFSLNLCKGGGDFTNRGCKPCTSHPKLAKVGWSWGARSVKRIGSRRETPTTRPHLSARRTITSVRRPGECRLKTTFEGRKVTRPEDGAFDILRSKAHRSEEPVGVKGWDLGTYCRWPRRSCLLHQDRTAKIITQTSAVAGAQISESSSACLTTVSAASFCFSGG
jgi:hypothetical protein